jgi:hypothetical protein
MQTCMKELDKAIEESRNQIQNKSLSGVTLLNKALKTIRKSCMYACK